MVLPAYDDRLLRLFAGVMAMLIAMAILAVTPAMAEELTGQQHFASPQQAVNALIAAAQNGTDAEMLVILGPESEDLIASGDPVADRNGRLRFIAVYDEQHRLEQESENRAVLVIGGKDYPFPIPIVRQGEAWVFDTPSGREEILTRRIGRNELHTIEVMHTYTAAQREYACRKPNGGSPEFARKFTSGEGQKDGLYWAIGEHEEESPFGPLIARATREGYRGGLDEVPPEPFHGYYFKILKAQGGHANGGAFDYVADGKMVLGFALLAYPANYESSGIMTFIVNQEGVIYEKDLGENTATAASAMSVFDPDESWRRHEEPAALKASGS
jgi:hypothetical protein